MCDYHLKYNKFFKYTWSISLYTRIRSDGEGIYFGRSFKYIWQWTKWKYIVMHYIKHNILYVKGPFLGGRGGGVV